MAKSGISITKRPPPAAQQYQVVRDEIRTGLSRVGDRTVLAYKRVVANWRDGPNFTYQVGSGPKQIFLRVQPKGTKKQLDKWNWIDKTGTRAHTITPKRGKFLRFVWGGPGSYDAKTKPGPARFGGSGKAQGGKVVYAKKVKHPGFPPRKFSEAINEDVVKELDKEIPNAARRGLRRAKG